MDKTSHNLIKCHSGGILLQSKTIAENKKDSLARLEALAGRASGMTFPLTFVKVNNPNFIALVIFIGAIFLSGCDQTQFPANHLFRATSRPVTASPLVVDFNRDGKLEVAIGATDGFFYLLDDSLHNLAGWTPLRIKNFKHEGRKRLEYAKGGFYSSPAAWDCDHDGYPEIFVAHENAVLCGWRFQPEGNTIEPTLNLPITLDGLIWSSPTIVADSLLAIGGFEKMFLFDRQGKPAPGWPQPIKGWTEATAAWCDDVLAIATLVPGETSRGYLYAWHLNGALYPNFPINLKMDSNSSPALADLDKDGRVEVIVGDDAGFLHVFTIDGSELPGFPRLAGDRIESSPAVVDLDGDNVLDIIVGAADGYVYVWNAVGDVRLGWPVATGDEVLSSPAVADIDGDGQLNVIVGSRNRRLYVFSADGSITPGFPIDCGDKIFSSPWVGDLDGDGRTDIVLGANNGIHRICNIGKLGETPWPMFRRDAAHSGALGNFDSRRSTQR
jgi:outer membrane protein assembly factor BamB